MTEKISNESLDRDAIVDYQFGMSNDTTDLPACASQDGAHPPIALTADAGAQTAGPVVRQVHGAFEDAQEQRARAIYRDIRTYGWAYDAGVSW